MIFFVILSIQVIWIKIADLKVLIPNLEIQYNRDSMNTKIQ